jgi:hypothetical protein
MGSHDVLFRNPGNVAGIGYGWVTVYRLFTDMNEEPHVAAIRSFLAGNTEGWVVKYDSLMFILRRGWLTRERSQKNVP